MSHGRSVRSVRVLIAMTVALVLLGTALFVPAVSARELTPNDAPTAAYAVGEDDEPTGSDGSVQSAATTAWEVGVHHSAADLDAHATAEGNGLYDKLTSCGWTGRYNYGNTWAWEEDFKRHDLGGTNGNYLDSVDLQFYVGHGSPGGFTFADTTHDDSTVTPADCYRAWGDGDNEWVALTSCQVLADSNLSAWAACMYGGHLILGFQTNASAFSSSSSTQGYKFAKYLCSGYSVPQAWYKGCDASQGAGRTVRALTNELDCLNDDPRDGPICADSYDTDAWVQTHVCGSETARPVDVQALNGTMPVFRTQALSLAEAETEFTRLGNVFNVPTAATIEAARLTQSEDPFFTSSSGGRELEMDKTGGLFGYYDLNALWTAEQARRAYSRQSSATAITAEGARTIADRFLTQNNLMGSGAQFYEVVSDTISGGSIATETVASAQASLLANEQPLVWQVIYSRIITYTPRIRGADADPVEFSVVGPGAKQKVYVATDSVGASSALAEPVVGAMGGWRHLGQSSGAGVQVVDEVPVLDAAQIYALYDQLANLVVLNNPPVDFDAREILTHTVAYWEETAGVSQADLIPAYELKVRYLKGGQEVTVDFDYVPANTGYMRPFARIDSISSTSVKVGDVITLTAADAAQKLNQLGYPNFDFALGSGNPDSYLYDWYINTIDDANKIGSGRTLAYTVRGHVAERVGATQQIILLRVTDIDSPNKASTSVNRTIDVQPRVLLPLITR